MIEAKIDITISIPELTAVLTPQEIKKFGGCMPIRNEDIEDYDPADKAESKTVKVHPKAEMDLALQSLSAKLLKDMCRGRDYCTGCLFDDEGCKIQNCPTIWRI